MKKHAQAIQLWKDKEYEEAAKLLIELIEETPGNPAAYVDFGNLLMEIKEFEKAANFLRKAIEIDDEFADAYYALGNLLYNESSFDEAITCFQKTMELGLIESDVYYMLAMSLCKKQHFIQALPYLQRATELSGDEQILFQLGLLLAQLEFIEDAEKVLKEVILKSPNHADALYNLGVIHVHKNEPIMALELLEKVLSLQPTHQLAMEAKKGLVNA